MRPLTKPISRPLKRLQALHASLTVPNSPTNIKPLWRCNYSSQLDASLYLENPSQTPELLEQALKEATFRR